MTQPRATPPSGFLAFLPKEYQGEFSRDWILGLHMREAGVIGGAACIAERGEECYLNDGVESSTILRRWTGRMSSGYGDF